MSLKNKSELAKYLDPSQKIITDWTVFRWYTQEGMPVIRIGRRVLFETESVEKWLASRERGQQEPEQTKFGVLRAIK